MYLSQQNRKQFKAARSGNVSKKKHYKGHSNRRAMKLMRQSMEYHQTSYRRITGSQLRRMVTI
jgi:hypothetical protein